jgi:hypothetical protein
MGTNRFVFGVRATYLVIGLSFEVLGAIGGVLLRGFIRLIVDSGAYGHGLREKFTAQ